MQRERGFPFFCRTTSLKAIRNDRSHLHCPIIGRYRGETRSPVPPISPTLFLCQVSVCRAWRLTGFCVCVIASCSFMSLFHLIIFYRTYNLHLFVTPVMPLSAYILLNLWSFWFIMVHCYWIDHNHSFVKFYNFNYCRISPSAIRKSQLVMTQTWFLLLFAFFVAKFG